MKRQLLPLIVLLISTVLAAQVPTITSFAPSSGTIGTSVTITGTNFDTTPANNIVFFGATQATVSAALVTELTVTVPIGTTYMPITVLVNQLIGYSSAPFVVTFDGGEIDVNSFTTKVNYTTGSAPHSVFIGDLDGDGKADMAVANLSDNTVSVFRNISNSGTVDNNSFATKVDYTTGTEPSSVTIGDLDGDRKPDLVVTNFRSNTVSILKNTSTSGTIDDASFATKVDFTTGSRPNSVTIADMDGDGKADLAMINQVSTTVSVFRNTSTNGIIDANSFANKVDFTTGEFPRSVSIGDLDGDGMVDLAVTNKHSATVSVYRNTSTSGIIDATSFAIKVDYETGVWPVSVSIDDLDGDGKADLALANSSTSNTVSVFRNISTSGTIDINSFASKVDFMTGSHPVSLSMSDLNGDGKIDLVLGNDGGSEVSVFMNTSTSGIIDASSFASKVDFMTESRPLSLSTGDMDGDGRADLIVMHLGGTVSVLRNTIVPPSTETDIIAFSFVEQTGTVTIDAINHTINIEAALGTDITALVATFALSDGASADVGEVEQTSGTGTNDFTNPVTYTITAEDGVTTQDWIITATESLNTETDITVFSFAEQTGPATIDSGNHTIDIEIAMDTDLISLVATFILSEGASVEVNDIEQTSSATPNDFTSPVTYKITAEDGVTTQDWIVNVSTDPLGLEDDLRNLDASYYPNPFTNNLSIDKGKNRKLLIEIIDISGKVMYSKTVSTQLISIDLIELKSGIFLLRLSNGNKEITQRVLKN